MKLSQHFDLDEMCRSDAATRLGIANIPDDSSIMNLKALCLMILEPLRAALNKPIWVNSGYRSMKLNQLIGGAEKSQHLRGQAADILMYGVSNDLVWQYIRDHLPFDQLIAEHLKADRPMSGWIHVSYAPQCRKEALANVNGEYLPGLHYESH